MFAGKDLFWLANSSPSRKIRALSIARLIQRKPAKPLATMKKKSCAGSTKKLARPMPTLRQIKTLFTSLNHHQSVLTLERKGQQQQRRLHGLCQLFASCTVRPVWNQALLCFLYRSLSTTLKQTAADQQQEQLHHGRQRLQLRQQPQ